VPGYVVAQLAGAAVGCLVIRARELHQTPMDEEGDAP